MSSSGNLQRGIKSTHPGIPASHVVAPRQGDSSDGTTMAFRFQPAQAGEAGSMDSQEVRIRISQAPAPDPVGFQ